MDSIKKSYFLLAENIITEVINYKVLDGMLIRNFDCW